MGARTRFSDFLENNALKQGVTVAAILSFLVANFIIFLAIGSYFVYPQMISAFGVTIDYAPMVFVVGLFGAIIFIKTNLLIISSDTKKQKPGVSELKNLTKRLKVGKWNAILIVLRLFYFNILNDLFMVLIIWVSFFSLIVMLGAITIKENTFQDLANVVGIIGILSGLFQIYIQSYREQFSKKMSLGLVSYFQKISKKSTFADFLEHVKKENNAFYNEIDKKLRETEFSHIYSIFRAQRSGHNVTNITLNVSATDDTLVSRALELSMKNKDEQKTLKSEYAKFFQKKDVEISKEIDEFDVDELRKIFLPNVLFFDETVVEMIKSNYELDDDTGLEQYADYRTDHINRMVNHLINRISGFDANEEK